MKKIYILFIALATVLDSSAQSSTLIEADFHSDKSFIENVGQFDRRGWSITDSIKFGAKLGNVFIFFTDEGLTYRFETFKKIQIEGDHDNGVVKKNLSELINIRFLDANSTVELVPSQIREHYNSYSVKNYLTNEFTSISGAQGFSKITYVNLYDNIDIEYTFHPDGGVKYNIILHPGADPSQIKMKYSHASKNIVGKSKTMLNANGEISMHTTLGNITEKAPVSYYEGTNDPIVSNYLFSNNILTYELENFDNSQEAIIDPWVISPNFNAGDFTREVETDASGNIYTIGGEVPMVLRKYTPTGVLIWQYNTPWDTINGDWLGTLATNAAGESFITQGTGSEIERVSTGGAMVWHRTYSPGGLSTEFWSITFNCDNNKLIVGGTGSVGFFGFDARIYDIDPVNGNVNGQSIVNSGINGCCPNEVRCITSSKNAKYIFQIHTDVGAISQNIGACTTSDPIFKTANVGLAYKCENFLSADQNGGGLKSLISNDNFFYVNNGDQVRQYDVATGALVNTVALPGGSANNGFGGRVVHCSGIDVDVNGNVYVGSMDRVVKFDPNLNFVSSINTSGGFTVYDVNVSSNGEVIAGGALLNNGTPTNRGSRIQSMNFAALGKYALVCCDVNICPAGPYCDNEIGQQLITTTPGGTWSGIGVNVNGFFFPSVSGVGNFAITYTLPCGIETIIISVTNCNAPLSVCIEANGDLTANGGNGPYTWESISSSTSCTDPGSIFDNDCSSSCGFFCFDYFKNITTTTYTIIATTQTLSAPIPYPVQVTDNAGAIVVVNNSGAVGNCPVIVLSAKLASYTLECQDDRTLLEWTTTSEDNNDYFEIRKAIGSGDYEVIGTIDAAGSTTSDMSYKFLDRSSREQAYYSLHQVDYDGKTTFLGLESINCQTEQILVHPNPFTKKLTIELGSFLDDGAGTLELYNSVGQIVSSEIIPADQSIHHIDAESLIPGVYIIRLVNLNKVVTLKVIKN